jgi:predicted AAA+ superfamily ATPase
LALHGVTPAEFEDVVIDPERLEISRRSGLRIAFRPTSTGKYLACVYDEFEDMIYPTTAYEVGL